MYTQSTKATVLGFLFLHQASATTGVLDITHLLQSNINQSPLKPKESHPYAPWSHEPHCTISEPKYCVYTSNTTGPHGLSLITTPAHARLATKHLNDNPLNSFFTAKQAEELYLNPSPWKIVDIRGKDKGVVATRRIKKYETFMIDQAAVVVDMDFSSSPSHPNEASMLKIAVDRLLVPDMIRDMSASHGHDQTGLESDIMKTNGFGSTVAGIPTKTLFPVISRINHACNPNAFVIFSRAGTSMAIKAYRDIEDGEEISISYILLGLPSAQRAHALSHWGFECKCTLCALPPRERQASDLRRGMVGRAERRVLEIAESYKLDEAIALAHESVDLIIDEDLLPMLTDEYAMLAMLYLEKGDRVSAMKYGRMAWDLLTKLGYLGVGDEEIEFSLERLLGNIGGLGGIGKGWRKKM